MLSGGTRVFFPTFIRILFNMRIMNLIVLLIRYGNHESAVYFQAVQMAKAGLKAIYLSGWQVAADANAAGATYPDQSLYPVNSAPNLVKRINNALRRADQIEHAEGNLSRDYFLPIIADAEAGFGGPLNAYELTYHLIEAGAAAVHFEDQLSSEKKCGHLGGKVLVPTAQAIRNLIAARLAADVAGVPTVIVARTGKF